MKGEREQGRGGEVRMKKWNCHVMGKSGRGAARAAGIGLAQQQQRGLINESDDERDGDVQTKSKTEKNIKCWMQMQKIESYSVLHTILN